VLPLSDLDEAERILESFTRDLQKKGLSQIVAVARDENPDVDCFEFSVPGGLAQGKPNMELDLVIDFADFEQKPNAHFQCPIVDRNN
jgi:hypothetical protein